MMNERDERDGRDERGERNGRRPQVSQSICQVTPHTHNGQPAGYEMEPPSLQL